MKKHILIVEDDFAIGKLLQMSFTHAGFTVSLARDEASFCELAKNTSPDFILLDLMINNRKSIEFYEALVEEGLNPHIPVIVLTASVQGLVSVKGPSGKSYRAFGKPFETKNLIELVGSSFSVKPSKA